MRRAWAPKHRRMVVLVLCTLMAAGGLTIILRYFSDSLVYFYAPSDLQSTQPPSGRSIRIGGLVKAGSLQKNGNSISFLITDTVFDVPTHYAGLLPNLFREGQGVVAEGMLQEGVFNATTVLAKHDERYMPPEVAEALKRSGRWKAE